MTTALELELRDVERAYLEHLGAAAAYAWRLQNDSWDQGAVVPRALGFWSLQPRTLRRLADMPPWTGLCAPPLETRDGPDPRVACRMCRGRGRYTYGTRHPVTCAVCRGRGLVVP